MKKTITVILCFMVVIMIFAISVAAEYTYSAAQEASITFELTTENNSQAVAFEINSRGRTYEIAKEPTITSASGQQIDIQTATPIENGCMYTLDTTIALDSITVLAPVVYFHSEMNPIVISQIEEDYLVNLSDAPWLKIVSVSKGIENDEAKVSIVLEAIGNRNVVPRLPKLIVGGKTYGALAATSYDDNALFCSGEFVFEGLPADISLLDAYIRIENVLSTDIAALRPIVITENHSVQVAISSSVDK